MAEPLSAEEVEELRAVLDGLEGDDAFATSAELRRIIATLDAEREQGVALVRELKDVLDAERKFSRSLVEALEAQYEVTERVMKAVTTGGPLGVELLSEWATATIAIREAAALAADPAPREEAKP